VDSFDKSSTLRIDGEVLNRSSFKKTPADLLARRVSNDATDPLYVFAVAAAGSIGIAEYGSVSAVVNGILTTVLTYTVPAGKTFSLQRVEVSGGNVAIYSVEINSIVKGVRRTYWGNFNANFNFIGVPLVAGAEVKVKVIHYNTSMVSDFDATLLGALA